MFEQDETCLLLLQWKVTSLIRPLLYKRAKLDLRLTNTFVFFYLPQTRTLHLHNPECGSIRDIFPIETVKGHVLVTCGQDGSIMLHQVHTPGILKNISGMLELKLGQGRQRSQKGAPETRFLIQGVTSCGCPKISPK